MNSYKPWKVVIKNVITAILHPRSFMKEVEDIIGYQMINAKCGCDVMLEEMKAKQK